MPGRLEKLRLGSISFINSLPVDLGLLCGAVPCAAEIVQAPPAVLNEKMGSGVLDLGPVSTYWYALHSAELVLLPDLSISSRSGVQSVLLFSRRPMAQLAGKAIAVTSQGRTTPVLLEILCRLKYGFKPIVKPLGLDLEAGIPQEAEAALLIGDSALLAKERFKRESWEVIDLAEEWQGWTRMPLVFAVWAVRRAVHAAAPDQAAEAHEALLRSKAWGLSHQEAVIRAAAVKTGLATEVLVSYFSGLSYDFDAELKAAAALFFEYAWRCGLLPDRLPAGPLTAGVRA